MNEFKVAVATMVASNETRYVVTVDHPNRPKDAKPWDSGRMEVFSTLIEKHAKIEAKRWSCFFANKEYNWEY